MKAPDEGARRYFFTPSDDGAGWVLVEALRTREGWEVRQAAKLGMRLLPEVPPRGGDWVEARPPSRAPRKPKPPAAAKAAPPAKPAKAGKPAKPAPAPKPRPSAPRAKPAVPPEKMPGLSQELGALLAEEQKRAKAPEGMVKCPQCGLPLAPTRNKRVRTHDDPVKGARCDASNRPWAEF
jgi:hypothetical protein